MNKDVTETPPYTVIHVQGKPVCILVEARAFTHDWLQSLACPALDGVAVLRVRDTSAFQIYDLPGLAPVLARLTMEEWQQLERLVAAARENRNE